MASGHSSSESPPPPPSNGAESPQTASEVALQFAELDFSARAAEPLALDPDSAPSSDERTSAARHNGPKTAFSWPIVILASYASAVTLALIWVLATGKTLSRFQNQTPARESVALSPASSPAPPAVPPDRSVALGETLVVGDLEIKPLMVLHRAVRISSAFEFDGPTWENPDCLILTIRLKNISRDRAVTPLEPPSARNGGPAEASYIEMGTTRRLSMFDLDLEGEWIIDEQTFPTIAPGATADIVLVSEPTPLERLVGPLTWWVALKTEGDELETVGVLFSRKEVAEAGG